MFILPGRRKRLRNDREMLGRWGEDFCRKKLAGKGYRLIAKNFRTQFGELDLVMFSPDKRIVFVEVRTRAGEEFVCAEETINSGKIKKVTRTAKYFVKKYGLENRPLQFDVAAVILPEKGKPEFRYHENAFGSAM